MRKHREQESPGSDMIQGKEARGYRVKDAGNHRGGKARRGKTEGTRIQMC